MWSTASCKYIFFQFNLMDSCFNSLIRLSKYLSSQFINGDGISFSGSFWIMVNSKSSDLQWSFKKDSLNLFGFLSSMFIINHSILLFVYIYIIPFNRKIYNIWDRNLRNYFLKIRGICLSFSKKNPYKTIKNSKKI